MKNWIYKPQLDLIYEYWTEDGVVPKSWDRLPFKKFEDEFCEIVNFYQIKGEEINQISRKVENVCKRLLMAWYGGKQAIEEEFDFTIGQDRFMPYLIGDGEIMVLYHLESMVLLGRSALDLVAYVFSKLLLDFRTDSFNKLRKTIIERSNPLIDSLKPVLLSEKEINWVDIVSGTRSRSLRDKIAHQTIINIEYWETDPNSDKKYCHVIVDKNKIPLEDFICEILEGITDFCIIIEDIIIGELNKI